MDPLSITLAVVSLATAVKDMVELAQKIHESFAKVPSNFQEAQRVAKDVKEMVDELKVFCEGHKDALGSMKDFHAALLGLLAKFRGFETSILPLLPRTGGRKRDRLFRGWDAWRKHNKIEGSLLDLQGDIIKVIRRFMMKSAMRTEVKLETIYQETSRGLTDVHKDMTHSLDILEIVRKDVSALRITAASAMARLDGSSGLSGDDLDRNIVMFARSSPSHSTPMLRTPNVITEEVMIAAYLKFQINSIAMIIEKMPTLPPFAPDSAEHFQLVPMLDQSSMSITYLRHHLVHQVTDIRDLLDLKDMQTISVHEAACALTELSVGLRALDMSHESILVGDWSVALARLLVKACSGQQSDLRAELVTHLLNQSTCYNDRGDKIQSLQTIEEAYAIMQNLRTQCSGEIHFQILYSNVLLQYAQLMDNRQSIKMTVEAVQILENVLNVQVFTQLDHQDEIERVVRPSPSFFDHLFSSASPVVAITSYTRALQQLGAYLYDDGHPKSALDLTLLAIEVRRKVVSIHGPEHRADLAKALLLLVRSDYAYHLPGEELVSMANECIQLLRELAEKNPLSYARELVFVLWDKACALEYLNRDAEATATWEEVAGLARQIVQDSKLCAVALSNLSDHFRRLEMHVDAVRTRRQAITTYQEDDETQASRYFHLSEDLQQLHCYKESAEAAQASVALYRKLSRKNLADIWRRDLATGLSNLALCLAASGDLHEALKTWDELLGMLDNVLHANPDTVNLSVLHGYLIDHEKLLPISYMLKDDEECLRICYKGVQYLRRLSKIYPQDRDIFLYLFFTEFAYAYNMFRIGSLQDAQQYIDHWLDVSRDTPDAVQSTTLAQWQTTMIILKAEVLLAQGFTQQAVLASQSVCSTVGPSIRTHPPSRSLWVHSIIQEALLRVEIGHSEVALHLAEGALQLSRDTTSRVVLRNVVRSLYGVSFIAFTRQDFKHAMEAAREGCVILSSPEGQKIWRTSEQEIFMRPGLLALLSSAEANLGRCATGLQYAHRAVGMSIGIKDVKLHISATTAERSYMETRGTLTDVLIATGDLKQARQICEERRAYFSKRVEKRMGEYRDLAAVLRMLGVLCCAEGHHEEGNAAAQELSRIMQMLGGKFPNLQDQVEIRLRNQAKMPILMVLDDMRKNLDCTHQAEDISLFAI